MVGWGVMATMGPETKGDMACDRIGTGFISAVIPMRSGSCDRQGICGVAGKCLSWEEESLRSAVCSTFDLMPRKW